MTRAPVAAPTRAYRGALAAVVAVLFATWTTYAWLRHAKYETTGFDLGLFDQVVRSYAHFRAPVSPLKGVGYNILGDHFHPVLVLLVPLYWVWDDPRVLLAAQAALFAVSVLPVAEFVRRRFGARAAVVVALSYGVGWPLQGAVHFDFHEIAFAVPLIALLVDALDRRRDRLVVGVCLALLTVREDMGALVLVVGVLVALRRPRSDGEPAGRRPAGGRAERWRSVALGGVLAVVGAAGYWLATSVVIPAMGDQGFVYWTFTSLGPDPVSALRYMVTHPWRVAVLWVTPVVKLHTQIAIFAPTAFLALGSPYVLLTLPFLAQRMLNDRELLWQTNFHYTSVIAPIVVMAAADVVGTLARRLPDGPAAAGAPGRGRRWRTAFVWLWVAWGVALPVWDMANYSKLYPVAAGFRTGRVLERDLRWRSVRDTLPLIPRGECVEADNQLAAQLTTRDYVTRVGRSDGLATWLVLDLYQKDTGWQGGPPAVALRAAQADGFTIVSWKGPIVLLHRDRPVAPLCRGLF